METIGPHGTLWFFGGLLVVSVRYPGKSPGGLWVISWWPRCGLLGSVKEFDLSIWVLVEELKELGLRYHNNRDL